MRIQCIERTARESVLGLGRRLHAESAQARLSFDEDAASDFLEGVLAEMDQGVACGFLAVSARGLPAGLLLGRLGRYPFSRHVIAHDRLFYVAPEFRGSNAAVKLLRGFNRWARLRGAHHLYLAEWGGIESKRFARLMRRTGFDLVGGNYGKWLKTPIPMEGDRQDGMGTG